MKRHSVYNNKMFEVEIAGYQRYFSYKEETDIGTFYFEAPVNARLLNVGFRSMAIFEPDSYEYSYYYKKFMPLSEIDRGWFGNSMPIHSFRAFKRYVRKNIFVRAAEFGNRYTEHSIYFVRRD